MSRLIVIVAAGVLCLLAVCIDRSAPASAQNAEQHMAATCKRWDAMVDAAAHPDAAAMVRHAKQMAHIADLRAAHASVETIVQAEIDADMLADLRNKEEGAASCWRMLGVVKQLHYEMNQRSLEAAEEIDSQREASFSPDPSVYTLHSMPPAAPSPSPLPNLGTIYAPPQPSPPTQFIPYGAVAPMMPGISPSGTAK